MFSLPQDGHVHSEWSWDAPGGDMERTCARAVELGLTSLAFTEHADRALWVAHGDAVPPGTRARVYNGVVVAAPLDVDGYLECIDRCRGLFPELRILSGVELGEPHLYPRQTREVLSRAAFDRVLGSVHSLDDLDPFDGGDLGGLARARVDVRYAYEQRGALDVVRSYLSEVVSMAESDQPFSVLAHIDYPLRHWPLTACPFVPEQVEEQYRSALEVLAASGRSLEVNTRLRLAHQVVDWWHDAGGTTVTFGSDAHEPDRLAWEFSGTAEMVAAHGFRPGPNPYDPWGRA